MTPMRREFHIHRNPTALIWRWTIHNGPWHNPDTIGQCGRAINITATRRGAQRRIRRYQRRLANTPTRFR